MKRGARMRMIWDEGKRWSWMVRWVGEKKKKREDEAILSRRRQKKGADWFCTAVPHNTERKGSPVPFPKEEK